MTARVTAPRRRAPRVRRFATVIAGLVLMLVAAPDGAAQGTARRPGAAARRARAATPPRTARPAVPVLPALHFTTPRGAEALAADLASLLRARTRTGVWGAMVVSLTRGDTLFAHEPGAALVPASTMKLFTAALALDRLGPEHTFSTDVLRDGPMDEDGVVRGNLILRGDGDPSLSTRFVRGRPDAPMTLLAELVAGAGVRRVTGDLIADATAVDDRRIPQGWLSRYAGAAYAAPYSALSLNENLAVVAVAPGDAAGRMARVVLEPAAHGIAVTSTVRTVAGRGASISARAVGDDQILVSGTIGAQAAEARYLVTMSDPARFTAGAFRAALAARGITVSGAIRLAPTPADAVLITGLPSPPLSHLVAVMNRESINVFAELLWRVAARGGSHRTR